MKTKVLIVSNTPLGYGGVTQVIINYYREMNLDNYDVDFVFNGGTREDILAEIEKNNGRVYITNRRFKKIFSHIKFLKKISSENKYDVVHIHGNSSLLLIEQHSLRKNNPIQIVHAHNSSSNYKLIHYMLRSRLYRNTDFALSCGIDAAKYMYGNKSQAIIINNAINTDKFSFDQVKRDKIRDILNLKKQKVILHVGFFNKQKNHEAIIDIFYNIVKQNKDYYLILIGSGEKKEEIINKVANYNLNKYVLFLDNIDNVNEYYSAADIFLMPSLYEGFPVTLVEAQASQLKIYCSTNISTEVDLFNGIEFIDLKTPPEQWAKIIIGKEINLESDRNNKTLIKKMIDKGYDIKRNIEILNDIYSKGERK